MSQVQSWCPGSLTVEPKKNYISIKLRNRVIAQIFAQRAKFWVAGNDKSGKWVYEAVASDESLQKAVDLVRTSFDRARA